MAQPPTDTDDEDPGLKQFLADEVRIGSYADLLQRRAEAAARGEAQPGASGNAYYVTFGLEEVVIEHHYLEDWPVVRVSYPRFLTALRAWRKRLP
jgi:hypothetical protein